MATFRYRLGRFAFRKRGLTALVWLLVLFGAVFAAASAPAPPADAFSMPGTESQKAFDLLEEKFPAAAEGAGARVVVRAPEGERITAPEQKAAVADLVADLGKDPKVWWLPKWLDVLLPNLDVEGEILSRSPATAPSSHERPLREQELIR